MTEATVDASASPEAGAGMEAEAEALASAARKIDSARMRQIGGFHLCLVMAALTLWGAAVAWSMVSGWAIAGFAAAANGLIAAWVISSTLHEWGHFAGARLSGAKSPVLEAPARHFFMFDFPMKENDLRQFLWMSWGGILVPWLLVPLALLVVPLSSSGAVVLVATLVARAVSVSVFEVPVALAAGRNGNPAAELGKAAAAGMLDKGRNVGLAAGIAFAVLLWLVV